MLFVGKLWKLGVVLYFKALLPSFSGDAMQPSKRQAQDSLSLSPRRDSRTRRSVNHATPKGLCITRNVRINSFGSAESQDLIALVRPCSGTA
jgi:hypothetical protein